jgi:hypothetical protein
MDPVTLYKADVEKRIASIDAPAWIEDGWTTEKPSLEVPAEKAAEEIDTELAEVKASAKRK